MGSVINKSKQRNLVDQFVYPQGSCTSLLLYFSKREPPAAECDEDEGDVGGQTPWEEVSWSGPPT